MGKIIKALVLIGAIGLLLFAYNYDANASTNLYNCYKESGRTWTSVQNRAVEAAKYGIWGYRGTAEQNNLLSDCMCPEIEEGILGYSVVTDYQKTLRSSVNSTQSTIPVSSLELKDGTTLTMAMLGEKVFLTLEPGRNKEEIIMCTGITASPAQFTGCSRGLAFSGTSTAEVSANKKSHGAGSIAVMSNVHYTFEELTDKDTDEIVNGVWTFTSTSPMIFNVTPYVSSSADTYIGDDYLATQKYVNDVGAGGFTAANVSTTYGLETYSTSPETVGINVSSSLGYTFDGDGALYRTVSSTGNLNTDSNGIYLEGDDDLTWTGAQTFSNTTTIDGITTINGTLTGNNTSTFATTTISNLCLGSDDCLTSGGQILDVNTTTAKGTWSVSTTTSATSDEVFNIGFEPKYIELDYTVQGHDASTATSDYYIYRGIAYYTGTTQTNAYSWNCDHSSNSDNSCKIDGNADTPVPAPVGTLTLSRGTATGNGSDIQSTLTVNSISATGFVLRCVTATGGASISNKGRCNAVWTAYR